MRRLFGLVAVVCVTSALLVACSPIGSNYGLQDAAGKRIDLGGGVGLRVPSGWGGTVTEGDSAAGRDMGLQDPGFRTAREVSLYSSLTDDAIGDSVGVRVYVTPADIARESSRFDRAACLEKPLTVVRPLPGAQTSVTAIVRRDNGSHSDSYAVRVSLLAVKSPDWALTLGAGLWGTSPLISDDDTQTVINLLRYLEIEL